MADNTFGYGYPDQEHFIKSWFIYFLKLQGAIIHLLYNQRADRVILSSFQLQSSQYQQVIGDNRTPYVLFKAFPAGPVATTKAEGPL